MRSGVRLLLIAASMTSAARAQQIAVGPVSECRRDHPCFSGVLAGGLAAHATETEDQASESERELYGLSIAARAIGVETTDGRAPDVFAGGSAFRLDVKSNGGPPAFGMMYGGGLGKLLALGSGPLHGPFVRAEGEVSFWLDGTHNQWAVDLPLIHAGYALHGREIAFELAPIGGLLAAGGEVYRVDGGSFDRMAFIAPEAGARLSLFWRHVALDARVLRWWARDDTSIWNDRASAMLCTSVWYVIACGNASYSRLRLEDEEGRASAVGIVLGAGFTGNLSRLK